MNHLKKRTVKNAIWWTIKGFCQKHSGSQKWLRLAGSHISNSLRWCGSLSSAPTYFLTFPSDWVMIAKEFELEIDCEHGRIILEKRRPEIRCTVVVTQRPGCLRYLPKILRDNINYSQSQWRCSLFHIYRAHQFSAVSRVTGRIFSSKP